MRKIAYVFLSYSSEDVRNAEKLKGLLEENGIQVWMANGSLLGGANFTDIIPPAIDNCSCFVLLLTEAAQKSSWVPKELKQAIHSRKTVIPVQLTEVPLTNTFSFSLIDHQVVTLKSFDIKNPNTQDFIDAVKTAVSAETTADGTANKTTVYSGSAKKKAFDLKQIPVPAIIAVLVVAVLAFSLLSKIISGDSDKNGEDQTNQTSQASFVDNDAHQSPEEYTDDVITVENSTAVSDAVSQTLSPDNEFNEIPEKYENDVIVAEYSNSPGKVVTVRVGERILTNASSVWPDCTIYSKDTRIAVGEGPLVKGISPGETVVVVVSGPGSSESYRVVVTE